MTIETDVVLPKQKNAVSETPSTKKSAARILSNYVDGRWVPASTSELLDVTNPASGEVLARVPLSGVAEVEAAVAAAMVLWLVATPA